MFTGCLLQDLDGDDQTDYTDDLNSNGVLDDDEPDADYKAIQEGYVSITPVSVFLTDEKLFEKLKNLFVDVQRSVAYLKEYEDKMLK